MSLLQNKVRAPEFPGGLDWINTTEPLKLKDLRGKIVVLDFWTYCCINCHHVMADLKKLEEKYAAELVVIGVHSAKFTTEQDSENIRQAVLRHQLEHPVVNDAKMEIWRSYAVRAWPTLVLIDPEGYVVGQRAGEGVFEVFDTAISQLVEIHEKRGTLDREKQIEAIEPMLDELRATLLAFPHKVLVDAKGERLFIADTNNDRIAIVDIREEKIVAFIGGSDVGRRDGSFEEVLFNKPAGMFLEGDSLYIADIENHLIRRADLKTERVQTIAGTGRQARRLNGAGDSLQTALNSPWDVLLRDGILYIANAGSHQLYRMDLETGRLEPHAGSGGESRLDSSLLSAQLAQPSGLTADKEKLYFADSEVSAIRTADFDKNGQVKTVAGGELFEYGKVDRPGLEARFQHPLGVVYKDGVVYVADTYNNVIRAVNVETRSVRTVFGSGEEGMADGSYTNASFDEPAGIDVHGSLLYIADTNNHIIRTANLETGEVRTLKLSLPLSISADRADELFSEDSPTVSVKSSRAGKDIILQIQLPDGTKLNPLADSLVIIRTEDGEDQVSELTATEMSLGLPEGGSFELGLVVYYCDETNEGLCYVESIIATIVFNEKGNDKLSFVVK